MNLFEVLGHYNYWVFSILLMVGMYAVIARGNLIKKLVGLSIFQSAVFLMYISMDKVEGGTAPILQPENVDQLYSNPLPQVLILTAIVVGVATTAVGYALIIRIQESFGSIEDDELIEMLDDATEDGVS